MKRIIFSALVCLSAGTASAADEVVKSSLLVNAIKFEVTDLTPDDGIAAGVTPYDKYPGLFEPSMSLRLGRSTHDIYFDGVDETINGSAFDPIEFARSNETGYLIKNETGISLGASLDLTSANAFIGTLQTGYSSDQYQMGVSGFSPSNWLGLTIAPHTALHLSAEVTQSIGFDLALVLNSPQWQSLASAGHQVDLMALNGASMTIWDGSSDFESPGYITDNSFLNPTSFVNADGVVTTDPLLNQKATIQVSFANDTDNEVIRYVELDSVTGYMMSIHAPSVEPEVPAIPEPGTAALMGLGLFAITTVVRRSRPTV